MQATRRFALGAWLFLGIGILLGARWSYTELGWGGYWAWDPVENAALLPWLCGTAYIHSIMIQEKRGMLRIWNVSLVLATGTLAIMGTFLVRSGILQSIHAFVQPGSLLRWSFLGLIALMAAGSIALVVSRRQALRSEHRLDSLLSREAVFLFQNLVLVALTFVIWWGTFFPLISEAITGHQTAVGPPWFDRYTVPLALVLVLLSGIGPLIAWRRVTTANLRRNFVWPVGAALVALIAMLAAGGIARDPGALILFAFVVFVLAAVAQELWRGARARRALAGEAPPVALVQLVRRNRRRYGGYIVHAGFAVLLLGVAASSSFAHVQDVSLRPGQSAKVGGYTFRYVRPTSGLTRQRISLGAVLDVSRDGKHVTTLRTTHDYYPSQDLSLGPVGRFFNGEDETRIGWQAGLRRDIWSSVLPNITHLQGLISQGNAVFERAMQDAGRGGAKAAPAINLLLQARDAAVVGIVRRYVAEAPPADFHLLVSPLISWLWIGGLIVLGGGLIALWPAPAAVRRRVGAVYSARLARELARP
jgi:cytochrome c-type biogenesis protein CcmF